MWKLFQTAKLSSQRPSNLVDIPDRWLALQFDNAVTLVGNTIESALHEQVKVGGDKNARWEPKYRLDQLLDPDFRLPTPPTKEQREKEALEAFKGLGGVKVIKVNN